VITKREALASSYSDYGRERTGPPRAKEKLKANKTERKKLGGRGKRPIS